MSESPEPSAAERQAIDAMGIVAFDHATRTSDDLDALLARAMQAIEREPQPTDGPDYHADHQAWQVRQIRFWRDAVNAASRVVLKLRTDHDTALDVIAMRQDHCVSREPDGWWWLKVGMDFEHWPKVRKVTDAERAVLAAAETRHKDQSR